MGGKPLATAAIAAAAVALRAPASYSVLAFGKDVVAVKSQDADKASEQVVTDVLSLRGHGTTDLAGALRAAGDQLSRSNGGAQDHDPAERLPGHGRGRRPLPPPLR